MVLPSAEAYCERGLTRMAAAAPGWRIVNSTAFLTGLFESHDARIESLSSTRGTALKDALADLSRSLELDPERGDVWLARARLHRAMGRPEACKDYEHAVKLLPTIAAVLIERSGHGLNVRNAKEALADAGAVGVFLLDTCNYK